MKMLKLIEKRRSVREYKDKPVSLEEINQLDRILKAPVKLEMDQSVELLFIEDGGRVAHALEGVAGYHGVMIKAPHYYAVLAEETGHYLSCAGYLAEWFVLNATKMNLGTCWIETLDKSDVAKRLLQLEDRRRLVALIAIGYPQTEHRVSNAFKGKATGGLSPYTESGYADKNPEYSKEPVSGRVSIEEIVYMNKWGQCATVETLESYGLAEAFYYMHLAPSWGNLQPWRFILNGHRILLAVNKANPYKDSEADETLAAVEAGIAMLYFEVAMHDLGLPGGWTLDVAPGTFDVPDSYQIAGIYEY